jgi:hypothetical protein
MNFENLVRAFDAVAAIRDATRRIKGPAARSATSPEPDPALRSASAGQLDTRLTGVVVAALKEAFDRDHARLELERHQIDEQRRRAEDALRAELHRQQLEREQSRLRLLVITAMVGWLASVLFLGWRLPLASPLEKATLAGGWILLLASLATAFSAMGRLGQTADAAPPAAHSFTSLPTWLLVGGLGLSAVTLLV